MRLIPYLVFKLSLLLMVIISSCSEERKLLLPGEINPEVFPTMKTTDVSTLISDSGITRYRITAPLWLVFEESKEPQWRFPNGVFLEKFDDFFRREATVDCDSAIYFKEKQLWRLDGYVSIQNMQGEKFLTPQLYWNQRSHTIYSDSFIHIEKSDRIIEGYGFESDERMSRYSVRNVSGIFPAAEFKNDGSDSTAQTTTVITGSTSPARRSMVAAEPEPIEELPPLEPANKSTSVKPASTRTQQRPGSAVKSTGPSQVAPTQALKRAPTSISR